MKMTRRTAVQLLACTGAALCLPKTFAQAAAPAASAPPSAVPLPPAPAPIAAPPGFGVAAGAVQADAGIALRFPGSRLVSRRQVRHLGPLGPAMPARTGRLVRAEHVSARSGRLQVPRPEIRPSVEVRLQGRDQRVEGREMGPGGAHRPVQEGRREILLGHGPPSRQLRQFRLEVPAVEQRQDRARRRTSSAAG